MKLWMMLPIRLQQYIATKVSQYGMRHNRGDLIIWGATHYPIVIEEE